MQILPRKRWLRWTLGVLIVLLTTGAAVYWYISTEKFADTKERKAAFTVNATDFIREFATNTDVANSKYKDQIIVVNGRVSEIEAADTTLNIKFIDTSNGSYAIFAFQEQYAAEAKSIRVGDSVSIKASFSSGIYSDILGTTAINFKRSTLTKTITTK